MLCMVYLTFTAQLTLVVQLASELGRLLLQLQADCGESLISSKYSSCSPTATNCRLALFMLDFVAFALSIALILNKRPHYILVLYV
jgi:hypothetical protein